MRVYNQLAEKLGVSEMVNGVREMFRKSLHFQSESASVVVKSRRNFRLSRNAYAFIDLDAEGKGIKLGFHPVAIGLVSDELNSLDPKEIPFETQPSLNAPTEEIDCEFLFPLNSMEDWESRKDKLAALTQKVYAAWLEKGSDD